MNWDLATCRLGRACAHHRCCAQQTCPLAMSQSMALTQGCCGSYLATLVVTLLLLMPATLLTHCGTPAAARLVPELPGR